MAQVLLDAVSDNLVGEMVEACRLSGVPLVVAVPRTMHLQRYLVGATWDERHNKTCGGFSLDMIALCGSSFEVAATLALRAQEGDVVITKDLLVAGMTMGGGATALSPLGREHDIDTVWHGVAEREHIRAEGKLREYWAKTRLERKTRRSTARLMSELARCIPKLANTPRVEPIAGIRLVVDADPLPLAPALAAARTHDLPVVAIHNRRVHIDKELLMTDPIGDPGRGGFWVSDVDASKGYASARAALRGIVRTGDIVFTTSPKIAAFCLSQGAAAIDGKGRLVLPGRRETSQDQSMERFGMKNASPKLRSMLAATERALEAIPRWLGDDDRRLRGSLVTVEGPSVPHHPTRACSDAVGHDKARTCRDIAKTPTGMTKPAMSDHGGAEADRDIAKVPEGVTKGPRGNQPASKATRAAPSQEPVISQEAARVLAGLPTELTQNGWLERHPQVAEAWGAELLAAGSWIWQYPHAMLLSIRERALEIYGDEKALYSSEKRAGVTLLRALRGAGASDRVLGIDPSRRRRGTDVGAGLRWFVASDLSRRRSATFVISENLDPWCAMRESLTERGEKTVFGTAVDGAIYAAGSGAMEPEALDAVQAEMREGLGFGGIPNLLWWGDVDRAGIAFLSGVRKATSSPVAPFVAAYERMAMVADLEALPRDTSDPVLAPWQINEMAEELSKSAGKRFRLAIDRGLRIPQEITRVESGIVRIGTDAGPRKPHSSGPALIDRHIHPGGDSEIMDWEYHYLDGDPEDTEWEPLGLDGEAVESMDWSALTEEEPYYDE